eukprot:3347600-Pyramimonas_sp.AAC.1
MAAFARGSARPSRASWPRGELAPPKAQMAGFECDYTRMSGQPSHVSRPFRGPIKGCSTECPSGCIRARFRR